MWGEQEFCRKDLDEMLRSWHELIGVILAKYSSVDDGGISSIEHGPRTLLSPDFVLNESLPEFWREFLTQARRPNFSCIAPGLQIPTVEELEGNLRAVAESAQPDCHLPLLLFAADANGAQHRSSIAQEVHLTDPDIQETLFPFAVDVALGTYFQPGLYLSSTGPKESNPYGDSSRLVLPYPVGSNKIAHMSRFNNTTPGAKYADVYQELHDRHGGGGLGGHDAQLSRLLDRWKQHVENEQFGWMVGLDGVQGSDGRGIDMFADADSDGGPVFYPELL
ncbi:hypothetical protein CLAFUW4_04612 [Fulvia fulva]|uniref:uncharacterized protein n=1 Tax=Passalora fulva TaxID=5499 RepID=UPI002852B0A8|nr:uncharacterized protein CLAFUR5_20184 [Fulvia fulva]KAK4626826.1 hypothetical protein CLAFUR4_04598 [Fulvia fulva]KAK4628462.1 hypothetical protein CLAFUR0_04600 [Fulvia fulva]WMI38868.1 hypothetical protein CLAFUR5_20184 [Fulvia fulva]WPV14013.1 hypothetical protein CLAFUW4_04612 [Fulvia fulva]WPV28443.1 hypothetical protein CLAFUW7_04604 [Fulvia fulva]